jgi:hypothetical protein
MHDQLVALTARPALARAGKSQIGHGPQRLGTRRPPRSRGTAQRVACRLEPAHEEGALLRSKPRPNDERPVRIPRVGRIRQVLGLIRLGGRHSPISANRPVELRGRQVPRELEQLFLAALGRHSRQRAHLGVRELAAREGFVDERQLGQSPRDPHVLPRRARAQRAAPGEPLGDAAAREAAAAIELRNELQPAACARVDV